MAAKKNNVLGKINNFVLNFSIIILSFILLIAVYTGFQTRVLGQNYANFFGYTMFEVQTDSMHDAISAGDWIIVKFKSKIELNDIITYELDREYITHRVVEIHNGTYITKGDANTGRDNPVDESQVIGKVEKTLSGFGILRKTIFNPGVLIMLIFILFLTDSLMKPDKKKSDISSKVKVVSLNGFKFLYLKLKYFFEKNKEEKAEKKQLKEIRKTEERNKAIEALISKQKEKSEKLKEESLVLKIDDTLTLEEEPIISKNDTEIIIEDEQELSENLIKEIEYNDSVMFEEYDHHADELEKTQFFRIIPVNADEHNETLLEIAKNEIAEQKKEENQIKVVEQQVEEIEEDDNLTKIDLSLLKDNTRKNKNLIDGFVNIKTDEINELIGLLLFNNKLQTNEPTIKNMLVTTYIHAKYYNYYGDKNLDYRGKNMLKKVERIFKIVGKEMTQEYTGTDTKYGEKVDKFINILNVVASIEEGRDSITELKAKKEFYKTEITKYCEKNEECEVEKIVADIISVQKDYANILRYFLKKTETNAFILNKTKVTNQKDTYAVNLVHKISFSRLYSDYIIDKTYEEGIIAENKLPVQITLLLTSLIEDMLNADFNNKYIIEFPATLYPKATKIWRILKLFEDEYAKSHITILIDFEDLLKNKKIIKKIRKTGFKFAIGFKDSDKLQPRERSNLYMTNQIFIDKKAEDYEKIFKYIPKDLEENIVYDDIYTKINNTEGE